MSIPLTWSQERWSSNLKLTENGTCVVTDAKGGIAFSKFVMKDNSGLFSAIFEIKNPRDGYAFIGVGLYGKIRKCDQKVFDEWVFVYFPIFLSDFTLRLKFQKMKIQIESVPRSILTRIRAINLFGVWDLRQDFLTLITLTPNPLPPKFFKKKNQMGVFFHWIILLFDKTTLCKQSPFKKITQITKKI